MERKLIFTEGEFYHIYNRGINKNSIFFSSGDWLHFQRLLYLRNGTKHIKPNRVQGFPLDTIDRGESLVDICAYAMMPNHFHLLVHEKNEGGISKFMGKFSTAFSMYMNKKYERSGSLMCKPFRAKHVDSDEYLRWLILYIHSNPIEIIEKGWKEGEIRDLKKTQKYLDEYRYSSYSDYSVAERDETLILNKDVLPIEVDAINLNEIPTLMSKGSPWT